MPAPLVEQGLEPECRDARPVEDLAVAELHRRTAVDRSIQVPVEVPVPLGRGVVEEATVQLHDEAVVLDVAVDDPEGRGGTTLALGTGKAMGALHPGQTAVLEHRAGAGGDVTQDSSSQVRPSAARTAEP